MPVIKLLHLLLLMVLRWVMHLVMLERGVVIVLVSRLVPAVAHVPAARLRLLL